MLFKAGYEMFSRDYCALAVFVGEAKTCQEVFLKAVYEFGADAIPRMAVQTGV